MVVDQVCLFAAKAPMIGSARLPDEGRPATASAIRHVVILPPHQPL